MLWKLCPRVIFKTKSGQSTKRMLDTNGTYNSSLLLISFVTNMSFKTTSVDTNKNWEAFMNKSRKPYTDYGSVMFLY